MTVVPGPGAATIEFTGDDLDALRVLGRRRSVAGDIALCREGDPAGHVYLIESGSVRIVVSPPSGRELILSHRHEGQLVGELSAFDGLPRSASVITNGTTVIRTIPSESFVDLVANRPTLATHFLAALAQKLRAADRRTVARANDDVSTRLAARLVSLSETQREHGTGNGELSLSVRQSDLASWIGATREAVSRELAEFRRRGLVRTGRQSLVIVDLSRVRELAEST